MRRGTTILCALAEDTGPHVVDTCKWLARELDGQVVLAHAFGSMGVPTSAAGEPAVEGRTSDSVTEDERDAAQALLEHAAASLGGVEHTTVLADDSPTPALLQLAHDHRARLLVAGTAVRGALDRVLAGSVSGDLAVKAPCPVVVVPDGATVGAAGPVVAGYDGSDDSLRAARHAAVLSAALGRQLVLVHIADDDAAPVRPDAELARELHDALAAAQSPLLQPLKASVVVEHGDPAPGLASVATEQGAALLVTGTRGRGGVEAALLGSVSNAVVRHAAQPVVLVGPTAHIPSRD